MGCEDNNNPNSAPLTESSSSVVTGVESSSSVVTGTESSSSVVTSVSSKIIFSCTSIDDGEQICVDYDGFEEYTLCFQKWLTLVKLMEVLQQPRPVLLRQLSPAFWINRK